jgi:hypothetical protein
MNKDLEKRLAALEGQRRPDDYKPVARDRVDAWLRHLDLYCIARSKARSGSILDGYAKACRYRNGASGLWATAYGNPRVFSRKHGSRPGEPGEVRLAVLEQFAVEELTWQLLDRIDANGGMLADHKIVDSGVALPLSDFGPMRPRIEPVQ